MEVLGSRSVASVLKLLLDLAFYGVALILAITVSLMAASPFLDLSGGVIDIPVAFSVDARTLAAAAPSTTVTNARIEQARGSLIMPMSEDTGIAGPFVVAIIMMAAGLWVLSLLRSVFRTLSQGRPFVAANARRIRWIAWAVLANEAARTTVVYSTNRFAVTHFTPNGVTFEARPDLNLMTIVVGLVILVISEVFRAGTALDEEQSLTV